MADQPARASAPRPEGHADDCEMMVHLLTGFVCTCGYDQDASDE